MSTQKTRGGDPRVFYLVQGSAPGKPKKGSYFDPGPAAGNIAVIFQENEQGGRQKTKENLDYL